MGDRLALAILRAKELLFADPDMKEALQKLSEIRNFKSLLEAFASLWWLLKRVVFVVEIVNKEYNDCTEEERIEVASKLLDDLIEFRGWLSVFEPFDNYLFKLLLSAAVSSINEKIGKFWLIWLLEKVGIASWFEAAKEI